MIRRRVGRRMSLVKPIAILAALIAPASMTAAAAHDVCLLPDTADPAPGQPFTIAVHLAERFPGQAVPWRAARVTDFFVTDSKGRVDLGPVDTAGATPDPAVAGGAAADAGGPVGARVTLRAPGTAVVSLSTDAAYLEMPAEEFEAYLTAEGHDAALEARRTTGRSAAPGRERYSRHVKTIVNAGGPQASVALTRAGLPLEIVPESDLSRLRPGGSLPVRVFYRGGPYVDGRVCATHEGWGGDYDSYAWCGMLDGAGRVSVPIETAGWQMIRTTRMIPIRDDPKADWESFWSTLTFHVRDEAAGESDPGAAAAGGGAPVAEGTTP
jgi:hypothetical protein